MKKTIYIILMTIFMLLLATVIYGVIEIILFKISSTNIIQFNLVLAVILGILGLIFGILAGFKAWDIIYVKKLRSAKFGHFGKH